MPQNQGAILGKEGLLLNFAIELLNQILPAIQTIQTHAHYG